MAVWGWRGADGGLGLEGPMAAPMAVFGKSRCRVAFGGSRVSEALAVWDWRGRWPRRWRFLGKAGAGSRISEALAVGGLEGRRWPFSRVKAPGRLRPSAAPMAVWRPSAVFGKSRCRVAFGGSRVSEALAVWGWRGRWPFWGRGAKKKRRRRPVACAPKSNHKFPEL